MSAHYNHKSTQWLGELLFIWHLSSIRIGIKNTLMIPEGKLLALQLFPFKVQKYAQ